MKKFLPLTLFLILANLIPGLAQPPCGMATDEPPGCVMCGPVYIGSTAPYGPGLPGPTFPCGTIENNQWLSIIAGSTDMSATILASNCQNGQGVQLLIYDQNLNPVSTCFSSGGNNIPGNVSASGLIPGDIYWIMIDGFAGDICDITLTTTGGVATGPPDPPGPISADPDIQPICPGAIVCYSVAPVTNASTYEWTVPANATIISGQGTNEICVRWNAPGGGAITVTPANPCFPGSPAVTAAIVAPIPPTIKPPLFFCPNKFPVVVDGNVFRQPGTYNVTLRSALGCDSVVQYIILTYPQVPAFIDTVICPGGWVEIGNRLYSTPGSQQVILPGAQANGCDSLINLNIVVLRPSAAILPPAQLGCNPGDTVILDGSPSSSGNNVTYSWTAYGGGQLNPPTNQNTATATSPGFYILTVSQTNANGTVTCRARDTVEVTQQAITINSPTFTSAQTTVCAGDMATYTISPVAGAISYTWTVPNGATFTGSGTSITVNFGTSTGGQVCVRANADCGNSNPTCIPVTINPVPTSDFTFTSPICQSNTTVLQYTGTASPFATYTWGLNGGTPSPISGPGPHNIQWATAGPKTVTLIVEENGCISTQTSHTVQVDAPLPPPVISCNSTQTSITFNWTTVPGATNYDVIINGVSVGVQPGTTYTVNNLNPGDNIDIQVIANGTTACGPSSASSSCLAQDCPDIDLNIDPVSDICRDANTGTITLVSNPTGGAGGGSFSWSGPGVSSNGVFDPNAANLGSNVISLTYMEGTCTYTEAITINVNEIPTADFTADGLICFDRTSTVAYTGSASATANFQWDFDGGTVVSGSGAGPYEIQWATGGSYTIRLTVTENGCTSPEATQPVQVDNALTPPNITCVDRTTNSVVIGWDPVPGATSYTVNLIRGAAGTYDPNTLTYTTNGLQPGDEIEIEVIAEGTTACGPSRASLTCSPLDCPQETVRIDPVGPFCKDGNANTVQLTATTGDNSGSYTWSGTGTSSTGLFDPNAPSVNPGTITVRATYTLANCTYTGTLSIIINEQPDPSFTAESVICIDETATITYTGNASAAATYNWDFGTGTVVSGSGQGPYEIQWATDGVQEVSLVVDENNCPSLRDTLPVQVDLPLPQPVINCNETQVSIDFAWGNVPGATSYSVNVLSGASGTYDGNLGYSVSSLRPGDQVTIEVIADGPTDCGPSSDTLTCVAQDCPQVDIFMPRVAPICLYPTTSSPSINLDSLVILQGTSGNENRRWHDGNDGNGYITLSGRFFPYAAGPGPATVCLEVEEPAGTGCFSQECITINIYPQPTGAFAVEPQICITDFANPVVISAPTGATFSWNFGAGNVISGSGAGPYEVNWNQPDSTYIIGLVIEKDGCFSDTIRRFVRVDEELGLTNFDCDPSNTSVFISWTDVPGATDYDVNVLTPGQNPDAVTNNSISFNSLVPQTLIEIELTISDSMSACPPVVQRYSCLAKECPKTKLIVNPITNQCLPVGGGYSVQMTAQTVDDPGNGTGVFTWSGNAVSPGGLFTPSTEGSYTIRVDYEYDACFYDTTYTVNLYQTPTANFTVDPVICETETSTVTYTGSAGNGATFNWSYDGGTRVSGTDRTPQEISWTNDTGNQNLSLTVTYQGCVSAPVSLPVQVDPELDPIVISCDNNARTTTSTVFSWNAVPGATGYEVFINNISQGVQPGTGYTVSGLNPESPSTIRVVARGNTVCGPVEDTETCFSAPCPEIDLIIQPVGPFCLNEATPVNLQVTASGSDGSGNGTWSGTAVSSTGTFNPIGAGPGVHTMTYTFNEQACRYTQTLDIVVNREPAVDAGQAEDLTCIVNSVTIGGASTPDGLQYTWELNGVVVGNTKFHEASEGGTYTLTVVDPQTGCRNSDNVFVDASLSDPELNAQVSNISCFGRQDGVISISGVTGGAPPFLYSINGSPYTSQTFYSNLGEGEYNVKVQDANGCEDEVTFEIIEPDELNVEIVITVGENPIPLGDSVFLEAITNYAPDLLTNVTWSPVDQFPICDEVNITNCLSAWVTPTGQTVYTVRVEAGPCAAEDAIQLNVKKIRPVYIPSGFSPYNQDGTNDHFQIFADPKVAVNVKSFLIFDRWGEKVFEAYNFKPSLSETVNNAWDGSFRGKEFNSGVFVYYAEIEFFDGLTEIFKGDVTIKR